MDEIIYYDGFDGKPEILDAISQFYYAIYLIDIASDSFTVIKGTRAAAEIIKDCGTFSGACSRYIDKAVYPEDAQNVRRFASTGYIASVLTEASPCCRVELRRGAQSKYQWIAINLRAVEFFGGHAAKIVMAAENIDRMKSSLSLGEQNRMQSFARKLTADNERRIRSMTEKSAEERSDMLLKMNSRGKLLYLALQKSSTQAFEYDIAADTISTILEWSDTGGQTVYSGGADVIAEHAKCSDRDTLALENAFNTACAGMDAQAEYADNSGEKRWKRISLFVTRVGGAPTGTVLGVVNDITREKLIAQRANQEQEFRRAVLGSSAYGMEIFPEGNTWRYLWRSSPAGDAGSFDDYDKALMSAPFTDIVAGEDFSAYFAGMNRRCMLDAWKAGEKEYSVDYRVNDDSGEKLWYRNVVHLLEDGETGAVKANVYISEINARKLEELAELANRQELAEKARAEKRANEMKSRFLTNMSHELRTPLNAILGMSQLALREEMSDEVRGYIHQIRTAGTGLLGVLNGILDVARIESGRLEIAEGEYKPMALMNDLSGMFAFQANDKALKFSIVIDPLLPSVLIGDEGHLREVFINLINNALKYTETGSVTVTVGQRPAENGIIMTASVIDTGVGIRAERLEQIFDKFDNDNSDDDSGSGLGLSISRELVRIMGGELKVQSVYGSGSSFSFEIPQKVMDSSPGGEFVRLDDARRDDGSFWNFGAPDATVMMVDDNSVNLRVGMGLLRPFGMRVITAGGGAEALELMKKEDVDLILMDHMMPDMDGVETTKRIRAMGGKYETLPILALTANAMKGVREMLLANGMDDYMSKPVEMWELSEKLRSWLPKDKVCPSLSAAPPVATQWPVNLPDIPGLDVAKGLAYMCTFSDYMTCLRDFWSIIPEKSAQIEKHAANGDVHSYTAEVHSLKSSSRLIGADTLADMAAKLEKLGHEGRLEDIRAGTGKLLTLYRSYTEKLRPYIHTEYEGKPLRPITAKQFCKKLQELKKYVKDFDCDSADHWSDYMRGVSVSAEFADGLERLHMDVLAARFSSCVQTIDDLLEKIKK